MEVGFAVIGVLLIGLPLVAVLGVRRLPPPRRRAVRPDPAHELSRQYRLSGSDLLRVQDAVAKGRAVGDQRLWSAAHAYAQLVLHQQQGPGRWPGWMRRRRWRYAAVAVYIGLVVALVIAEPSAIGGLFIGVLAPLLRLEQRRKAERALAANAPPARSPEFDIVDGG